MNKKFTEKQIVEAINDLKNYTFDEVLEKHHVSKTTLYSWTKKLGISRVNAVNWNNVQRKLRELGIKKNVRFKNNKKAEDEVIISAALKDYLKMTRAEVAKKYKVSMLTVTNWARKAGFPKKDNNFRDWKKIIKNIREKV